MELTEKHRGVAKRKLVLCSLTHLPVIENMHLCGSSDLSDSQIPGLWKWVITFYFFHFKLIWPRLLQFASLQIWTPKAVFLLLLVTFNKSNEIIAFSRGALTQRNVRRSKPAQNQTCKNSRNCYWARCACPLHTEDDVSYIMGYIKRFKPQGAVLCCAVRDVINVKSARSSCSCMSHRWLHRHSWWCTDNHSLSTHQNHPALPASPRPSSGLLILGAVEMLGDDSERSELDRH